MNESPKVLVVAGSLRKGAYSKKLARVAAESLRRAGATVDLLELEDVAMPPYDGDLEEAEGLPPGAVAFKARLAAAEGFLFCSPEYNQSVPGTFKNAIDWASRGEPDVFEGKTAALMGSSPGGVGGMRALAAWRPILTALGVWQVPDQVTVSKAHEAFGEDGALLSARTQAGVDGVCDALVQALRRK